MNKKCAFTICAKNYLAQALSLKDSFLSHNDGADFKIFLADRADVPNLPEVVTLEEGWLSGWKQMAFKYDVIEFNTSIKPFVINYLFDKGYEKVVYLDPDTYVFDSLDYVFDNLGKYSIILTPHRCYPTTSIDPIPDTVVSNVGIYNLGFCAFLNDKVGREAVAWWMTKLKSQCYTDLLNGLFVDQKWMDFIPGFYPNNVLISHHLGLNYAMWNIQEREIFYQEGKAMVKDKKTGKDVFNLVFFHFSGYSPLKPNQLDKRNEDVTTDTNPELLPLLNEYHDAEMRNRYDFYSTLRYSFNSFTNGLTINPLIRRAFRVNEDIWNKIEDPFDSNGKIYKVLRKSHLISNKQVKSSVNNSKAEKLKNKESNVFTILRIMLRTIGVDNYILFLKGLRKVGNIDFNSKNLIK